MARRSTPERIDEARRAAVHNRLVGLGVTEATADAWIAAWMAAATRDGVERGSAYWTAVWEWIADQRERRAKRQPVLALRTRRGIDAPRIGRKY